MFPTGVHDAVPPALWAAGAGLLGLILGFAAAILARRLGARGSRGPRPREDDIRLLLRSVTDYAIFMLDAEGRVANWNAGAARIKGYAAHEIVGAHLSRFYTEDDRRAGVPEQALASARDAGKFAAEGWRLRKDGSRFWASVVIEPVRDDAGALVGYAKITRDVTERREAQGALEQAREALAQSQKMEAVGQLTGGVAHDFNNLLMAVLGSLELLRKRLPDDPRALRLLDNAVQGAERGAALTQRMLAFARRQALTPAAIDLHDLVRGMADLLQRSIGPSVRIETRFPLGLPRVLVDAHQLELALLNLAVNARDAMPDGGTITIAAERATTEEAVGLPADAYLCLSVADTGSGMDAATLARAQEPFFTTKGVGRGTGLGLSMVHGLAEQSQGRLALASRVGEGTTARILLPVAAAALIEDGAAREGPRRPRAVTRALVVLLVDDDPLVLENTAAMLDDLGHRVIEARSGADALALFARTRTLDLVITDHAMPEMTGLQLAQRIGALQPELPVILATGFAELSADANVNVARLDKPFGRDALVRAIDAAFAEHDPVENVLPFRTRAGEA